ncbi:MAG: zinc dependent phospholipase C family protein [Peptostreptococcaceae bacterium]|nr:zinc dependent phospholipase C family protein [Peptostreptococcaceae bacterium]
MFVNTHILIGKSIVENINENKSFFISDKNFIYGNIKPDISSKYVLQKHYLEESLEMIFTKVEYLCTLNLDCISKYFSISKFSQELGVICHFLCDFFCVPHSRRWEMTHSMNKHITYEKELSIVAKETDLRKFKGDNIEANSFREFFNSIYLEYQSKTEYKNDLLFSNYVCNSVVDYILDAVLSNTAKSYTLINCG